MEDTPVLVIAADTIIGLAVVRSLGRKGVPVYCAYTIPDALGPRSKYSRGAFEMPRDPDAAMAGILSHIYKWKITHIMGVSEGQIELLNRCRKILEKECTLLFPPQEVFEKASHKDLTIQCARELAIPLPKTAKPQTMQEVDGCQSLRFPVILKLAYREPESAFKHKYMRIDTFDGLRKVMSDLPPGQFPMVQEYVPGHGIGMSMLMRGGRAVLAFQHRRIREFPPEGGVGTACEAMPLDATLFAQSERLLSTMAWEGVAMVEYRGEDPCAATLMEVNGRFWGSLPLAIHAGADFPFWLYRTALGSETPPQRYEIGLRARLLVGDTKWLYSVLQERKRPVGESVRQYLGSFRPSMRYFIWSWDDPIPAVSNFTGRFWRHKW